MINWKELSNEIRQTLPGIRLLEEEPLARHTSFRIGGPAAVFAQPSSAEELAAALVAELLKGPADPTLKSPFPKGTALLSAEQKGTELRVDLSAAYSTLSGVGLSLADYAITLTLTQLPNVNAVSITADGRELPYRETQVLLSADTLLSSRESGLRPITVSLYFLDSKTGELRAEQQTLALYEGQTRVNALLEALAQGPEDDSLVSLLPEDFAVISSRIENGVCYLNLPANVSLPENEAERGLMLSALEQSILSLGGVDEVQFLIEGSAEPDGYRSKRPSAEMRRALSYLALFYAHSRASIAAPSRFMSPVSGSSMISGAQ